MFEPAALFNSDLPKHAVVRSCAIECRQRDVPALRIHWWPAAAHSWHCSARGRSSRCQSAVWLHICAISGNRASRCHAHVCNGECSSFTCCRLIICVSMQGKGGSRANHICSELGAEHCWHMLSYVKIASHLAADSAPTCHIVYLGNKILTACCRGKHCVQDLPLPSLRLLHRGIGSSRV